MIPELDAQVAAGALAPVALDRGAIAAVVKAADVRQAVVVDHSLSSDVTGSDEDFARLAATLPSSWISAVDGDVEPFSGCAPAQLGPLLPRDRDGATVTRIYHLQRAPKLRPLTDSVYNPIEEAWPKTEPWLERDAGFFLTSPNAVTPAHSDRHHNVLVQLQGTKRISYVNPGSRAHAVAVSRSCPSLRVSEMPPGVQTIDLGPGSACYLPPYAIHWVHSIDQCLAISCSWRTAATVRAGQVYAANSYLRRLGVPIQPLGGQRDDVKIGLVAFARRLKGNPA